MSPQFNFTLLLFAALALAGLTNPLPADEIYRWIDDQGRVQFGDKPPPDGAERLELSPASSADSKLQQRREKGERLTDVMAEDRRRRKEEKRAGDQAQADNRDRCNLARRHQSEALSARYIYQPTSDPNNPRILDDTERRVFEQQLLTEVRRYCGKADVPE